MQTKHTDRTERALQAEGHEAESPVVCWDRGTGCPGADRPERSLGSEQLARGAGEFGLLAEGDRSHRKARQNPGSSRPSAFQRRCSCRNGEKRQGQMGVRETTQRPCELPGQGR